jgi:hypothetical protein
MRNGNGFHRQASYREPADLPIEVAMVDPLDGEFCYGDDPNDDQLRRGREQKGPDRTGRPGKPAKAAGRHKTADVRLDIELEATRLLTSDPRYKVISKKVHRQAIAYLAAGLNLGLPYLTVSDLMFGDVEPITPNDIIGYGFPEVVGYMDGTAATAPPLSPKQKTDELDELLREWTKAKGRLEQLKPEFDELTKTEAKLRADAGAVWQDLTDKTREVDSVLYAYSTTNRANPSYKKAIDKIKILVDPSLHALIDAAIDEFTSFSRLDTIKMKGKTSAIKIANDLAARRLIGTLKKIVGLLDQILSEAQASGATEQFQRAARRRAPVEIDWTRGLVRRADLAPATAPGFKDGDNVQDPSGRGGRATLMPDGGLKVDYQDGGSATYDAAAVQGGGVKRAARDPDTLPLDQCLWCGGKVTVLEPFVRGEWQAACEECYDGAPDAGVSRRVGHGSTKAEAVEDYRESQIE